MNSSHTSFANLNNLMMFFKVCILLVSLIICIDGQWPPTEADMHSVVLQDGVYTLFWKYDASTITFETHTATQGWVGLGFSADGTMSGADIVIGFVRDDGLEHITDSMSAGHGLPTPDKHADYTLLTARKTAAGTMLKFSRPLTTGDRDDFDITTGGINIIYAYGNLNTTERKSVPVYHGQANRGSKLVTLIDPSVAVGK